MYGRIYDPGRRPYPTRVVLAPRAPGWVFHNMRGGIDPGDHPFRPRFVGIIDKMNGRIYDPEMVPYPPLAALVIRRRVSTPCEAVLTRHTTVFVPGLLEL